MKPKSGSIKPNSKPGASETPVITSESGQTTKVLALINENSSLTGVLSYLKKRDYTIKQTHTLMDGIRELSNFKPDVLLISWNLKNTDIKKVHSVITQKFSAICYILGEDESTKSAAAMLSSGLPNVILYPVGGVNLYNRIQLALGRTTAKAAGQAAKKKVKTRDKTLIGGVEYRRPKRNEIPVETVWHVRVNSPNSANQIWETVIYKSGKPQYYYYKGEKPPDKWLAGTEEANAKERSYVFMSETSASADILSSFQDYSETINYETESDLTDEIDDIDLDSFEPKLDEKPTAPEVVSSEVVEKPEVKVEPAPSLIAKKPVSVMGFPKAKDKDAKPEDGVKLVPPAPVVAKVEKPAPAPMPVTAPAPKIVHLPKTDVTQIPLPDKNASIGGKAAQTLLEKSVNNAIALAMKSEVQSFEAPILIDEVSNLTVSVIKSSRFKGYLVSGQASDVSNPKFMKKVFDNLGKEMEAQNEALSTLCGVLELKLDAVPFKKWTKEKADFVIQSQIGNEEILFAFVPVEDLPQNFIDEDLVPVPIERFEEDKILYFDIFIYMPMNNKHILYLRNGAVFTKLSKDRLKSYNTKVLYVKKADENLFFAYSARNVFEKTPVNRSIPLEETKKPA